MYNFSITGIELTHLKQMHKDAVGFREYYAQPSEHYDDLLKVIESQTTPKAMGGET